MLIASFVSLGKKITQITAETHDDLYYSARANNPWFDAKFIDKALAGMASFLTEDSLTTFLENYTVTHENKKIGVIMAGNIPAVGFHDLLMVVLSGNQAVVKLSSDDAVLIPYLYELMDETLRSKVKFVPKLVLKELDAIIATGSNNSARYFEAYFKGVPTIIRKSRTSCAVLTGEETADEIKALGEDITNYFGKGCRSVTKLFVPEGYSFQFFLDELSKNYADIIDHTKYCNNYDYYKSIYLVDRIPHLDTGFSLFTKKASWGAPIAVVYYEEYRSENDLQVRLESDRELIQCVVGKKFIPFGSAQSPAISDYADGVDTMKFLTTLCGE